MVFLEICRDEVLWSNTHIGGWEFCSIGIDFLEIRLMSLKTFVDTPRIIEEVVIVTLVFIFESLFSAAVGIALAKVVE